MSITEITITIASAITDATTNTNSKQLALYRVQRRHPKMRVFPRKPAVARDDATYRIDGGGGGGGGGAAC